MSLSRCIFKTFPRITRPDRETIMASVERHVAAGVDRDQAEIMAVKEMIDDLQAQRLGIVRQVIQQFRAERGVETPQETPSEPAPPPGPVAVPEPTPPPAAEPTEEKPAEKPEKITLTEEGEEATEEEGEAEGAGEAAGGAEPTKKERKKRKKKEPVPEGEQLGTFKDIGQLWDPYKRVLDEEAKDPDEKSVRKVLDRTSRARAFAYSAVEGSTHGVSRYVGQIRDAVPTFQEWYAGGSEGFVGTSIRKIMQWTGERRAQEMEAFKTSAAQYLAFAKTITDAAREQNIATARAKVASLFFTPEYFQLSAEERHFKSIDRTFWTSFAEQYGQFYPGRYTQRRLFSSIFSDRFDATENVEKLTLDIPTRKKLDELRRSGLPDVRAGKSIMSTEEFNAPFAFKGVQFGDWVSQLERQRVVNMAFDAFHDIATLMGLSDTEFTSFAGKLGMQFGNLGTMKSKAAAFFLPSENIVNLTKTKGDGSLLHEWAHGLDFVGHMTQSTLAARAAFKDMKNRLGYVFRPEEGEKYVREELANLDFIKKFHQVRGEKIQDAIRRRIMDRFEGKVLVSSEFRENSRSAGRDADYYSDQDEMWSRAVEAWGLDTLAERGAENNYLVNEYAADGAISPATGYRYIPYPAGDERAQFNKYLTEFFGALEWKRDEKGDLTIDISADYELIQERERKRIIELRDELLARIDEILAELFPSEKSPDGLYWYAYKSTLRGMHMQPRGYWAHDDSYSHEKAEEGGRGAVGYPKNLTTDEMMDFGLIPFVHQSDTTVYLKEGERGDEREPGVVGGDEVELGGEATEHGEGPPTGGAARPGAGGVTTTGEGDISDITGQGGPREPGGGTRAPVGEPAGRGGPAEPGPGPDASRQPANYFISNLERIDGGTVAERFTRNIAAIRTLKDLETSGRLPTEEEKDTMALYSGWGGLANSLAGARYAPSAWRTRAEIVDNTLTEEEAESARRQTDVAFYTPASLYAATYKALKHMGFRGGKVLGPALGVGHEFGTLPHEMRHRGTMFWGIEPDAMAYRIAKQLYGASHIENAVLQDVALPLRHFDLAISNVPFSSIRPADKRFNKENFTLHDYFFRRALAHLKPGGMVAFITSIGTMDKTSSLFRSVLKKEGGEFVAAFRLPSIFSQTEAGADLIFIRKQVPGSTFQAEAWENTVEWNIPQKNEYLGQESTVKYQINEYFDKHKDHILGTIGSRVTKNGKEVLDVLQVEGQPSYLTRLESLIETLPKDIIGEEVTEEQNPDELLPAPDEVRDRSFYLSDDDVLHWKEDGVARKAEGDFSKKNLQVVKELVRLKTAYVKLLRADMKAAPDAENLRQDLNRLYDRFFKAHGTVNSQIELVVNDVQHPLLLALEHVDPDTEAVSKEEIFTQATVSRVEMPTHAENVDDGLALSLAYRGRVDLEYISSLTGTNPESVMDQLGSMVYDDPAQGLVTKDLYLSGNVREKLREAEAAAKADQKYQRNVDALKSVQPVDLEISGTPGDMQIHLPLGSPALDGEVVAAFAETLMNPENYGLRLGVTYDQRSNTWGVKYLKGRWVSNVAAASHMRRMVNSHVATRTWGIAHPNGNFFEILKAALNNIPIVIKMKIDEDGQEHFPRTSGVKGKLVVDKDRTTAANLKLEEIQFAFEKWLLDPSNPYREKITRRYNDAYNSDIIYKPDGSHLARGMPGTNRAIKLAAHQLNAIWRWIVTGNTYLSHEVGTGKTYEMAGIIMEARRLKLRRKPLLVAHGPTTVRQLEREFIQLYPTAKLLVVDLKSDAAEKQKQIARIQSGDYDAIIMTKQSFGRMKLSPTVEAKYLQEELADLENYLTTMPKDEKEAVSNIQEAIKRLQESIKKLLDKAAGTELNAVYFDDSGIDMIVVDEAHAFKNVPFYTRLSTRQSKIKGIKPQASARAADFFIKSKFMNETYPGGIVLASGTPLTNSVAELYNISRVLQPEELRRRGIFQFDAWSKLFGVIKSVAEPAPTGEGFKWVQKFAQFANLPELIKMTRLVMDVVTGEDIGIERPVIRGGKPENIVVEQHPDLAEYQKIIVKRAKEVEADPRGAKYLGKPDIMLRIISDGKKAAIDYRLIDENTPEQKDSKVVAVTDRIIEEYKKTTPNRGVQLVFADLGVPHEFAQKEKAKTESELAEMDPEELQAYLERQVAASDTKFDVYNGIKDRLVKLGIPAEEIEFVQAGSRFSGAKKEKWLRDTYRKVRAGKIRVFIGSTETMGTGVNVQDRVTAMHHMDVWWNFAGWVQRNGRGWRRGNKIAGKYGGVAIYNYGTKQTVDSFVWGVNQAKGQIIGTVMEGNLSRRRVEDISQDTMTAFEMMAATSGRPEFMELANVTREYNRLLIAQSSFLEEQRSAREKADQAPRQAADLEKAAARAKADAEKLDPVNAVRFDGDEKVYLFEKHGKEIAAKLSEIFEKSPAVEMFYAPGGSKSFHFATLGTAEEGGIDEETKKKTYDFKESQVRVGFRSTAGHIGGSFARQMDGANFLISGDLAVQIESPYTEKGSVSLLENITDKQTLEAYRKGVGGTVYEVGGTEMVAIHARHVGNLSRTITNAKAALAQRQKSNADQVTSLKREAEAAKQIVGKPFPQAEKLEETRRRKAALEEIVKGTEPAKEQQPARRRAEEEPEETETIEVGEQEAQEEGPEFMAQAATGWEKIEGSLVLNPKAGPESSHLKDLKRALLGDVRFSSDAEFRDRILDIREVEAPADEDAVLAEQFRKVLGPQAKIVYVTSNGLFQEVYHPVYGVGDVIFVDVAAPRWFSSLVAHGAWHADNSRHKTALLDVLKKTVAPSKFDFFAKELRALPHYAGLSDEKIWDEFGARFLEDQITQPSFWESLSRKSRLVYLRISKWIIDTLGKMGVTVGGKPPSMSEYFAAPSYMAKAIEAAQEYVLGRIENVPQKAMAVPGPRLTERRDNVLRRALTERILEFGAHKPEDLREKSEDELGAIGDHLQRLQASGEKIDRRSYLAIARPSFMAPPSGSQDRFQFIGDRLFTPSTPHPAMEAEENPFVPPGTPENADENQIIERLRSAPVVGRMFLKLPDEDLRPIVRLVALPWWIAKRDPRGRRVMQVELRRQDERNEMFVALTRSTAAANLTGAQQQELERLFESRGGRENVSPSALLEYASMPDRALHAAFGWGGTLEKRTERARAMLRHGTVNEFLDLDFKQAEKVGKAIVESDRHVEYDDDGKIISSGKIFVPSELRSRFGLDETGVVAYYAWRSAMSQAWETKLTYAQAAIYWPYQRKEWMLWSARTIRGPISNLPLSDLERVVETQITLEKAIENIRQIAPDRGLDADQAVKEFKRALEVVKKPATKLQEYRARWGKVKFYFPRFREQGPVVLRAVDGDGKQRFYKRYEPIAGTDYSRAAKVQYDELVREYGADNVEFYRSPVTPDDIYGDISQAALERFINKALTKLQQDEEITEEEAGAVSDSLYQELANELNVRGFGQRAIPRKPGEAVLGYQEERFQEIFQKYMSGLSGFLTKRKAAMEFYRALSEMKPKVDPETGKPSGPQRWQAFDYWRRYVEDMLRNQDRGDEISAKIRSVAFLYFISGNLKSAFVNLTQNYVSTIPTGNSITDSSWMKVHKAMLDVVSGHLEPDERRALKKAHDRGETTAQYIEDVMQKTVSGGWTKPFRDFAFAVSMPFRKAEVFNRRSAFLFAYRVFSKEKGLDHAEAMEKASDFVYDTQYLFGKANLPEWARAGTGGAKLLRTSYTFRSYTHNYLNAMAHFTLKDPSSGRQDREYRVLLGSLAALAVLGGAGGGVPFLDSLLDLLERYTGTKWRTATREFIRKHFGPLVERFYVAGLPGVFGIDISGSLAIGLPEPTLKGQEDTLYGVYGGLIDKGTQAIENLRTKQYARAAETALPSFASNVLRSVRESTAGVKSPSGVVRYDEKGRPLVLEPGEAVARAIGFRPMRESLASREQREYQNLKGYYQKERSRLYSALRAAKSPEERSQVRSEIQEYNRGVLRFRGAIPRITPELMQRAREQRQDRGFMKFQEVE